MLISAAQNPFDALLQVDQAYGAFGVAFGGLAGLMPRRRLILACSGLGSACFGVHNLMLGSTTGAALCALSVLQSLAACAAPEEGDRPGWLLALLGLASLSIVLVTMSTWSGWLSLCAGLGSLLSAGARLQGDPQRMRQAFLVSSLCWVGHNSLAGSACGLLSDTLAITGHVYGLWQNRTSRPDPAPAPSLRLA